MDTIINEGSTPTWAPFTATSTDFNTSARKYRSDFLKKPVRRLVETIGDICTIRPGIRFEEKQYDIDANLEFGNYDPYTYEEIDPEIGARVLRTFFGSVWRKFDPNKYYMTMLGSSVTKGEGLKTTEIVRLMLTILSAKLGDNLRKVIFSASHVDGGKTSATLFNGWDTVTTAEITAGNIAVANGNLYNFTEAITSTNAVDALKAFCRAASDYLMDKDHVNLIVPRSVYYDYLEDYKTTTGAVPYNTEYKKHFVEGFENVMLRPMAEKQGSPYLHLTTKDNMLVGCNLMGEEEQLIVEKHHPVLLDFFATIFFGTDFQSIEAERMLVGKLLTT